MYEDQMTVTSVSDMIPGYLSVYLRVYIYTHTYDLDGQITRHFEVFLFPWRIWAFRIVNTSVITRIKSGSYAVFIYLYSSPLKCIVRDWV